MAEVESQRRSQIAALEYRLAMLRKRPLEPTGYDDALEFEPGDLNFARAARVALDTLNSCASADYISRVILRPYPSKYDGAWRVEASYTREGPCAGAEAYLPFERLIELWG